MTSFEPTDPVSPIVRDQALQHFSHEHHQGLLVCWKIRAGISKSVDPARIKNFCLFFYEYYLRAHLQREEQYLFPLLGMDNQLIKIAMTEHVELRSIMQQVTTGYSVTDLLNFERILNLHIRFEERVLFNAIQKVATPDQLQQIAAACAGQEDKVNSIEHWKDEFWK